MFKENLIDCMRTAVPAISIVTPEWERAASDVKLVADNMNWKPQLELRKRISDGGRESIG